MTRLPGLNRQRLFQSTHPVRGATVFGDAGRLMVVISIHAPREGCDADGITTDESSSKFQSTHPVRGATAGDLRDLGRYRFQSTHPVRGATTDEASDVLDKVFQSTHPVRGATAANGSEQPFPCYFNPRTP